MHVPEQLGLAQVFAALAQVSILHSAQIVATDEEGEALAGCMTQTLEDLQDELSRLEPPARSPLAAALARVAALREAGEEGGPGAAREFVARSQCDLAVVERALRDAVSTEMGLSGGADVPASSRGGAAEG